MRKKQQSARGEWVYLRDGSLLGELLEEEVGVKKAMVDRIVWEKG